ncbi:MAG TPA: S8 family serine peptidase [Nocardioidaceae bacterium]|nr:S8 family serine peptidase [Nocardioidaceae bacterium]
MGARLARRAALGTVALAMTASGLATSTSTAASPKVDSRANDLGIQVVRFAKGTSPAQMRAAVSKAGATIVTDLTQLRALAVVPKKTTGFRTRISAQKGVRAFWLDRVTAVPNAVTPDPLHDLDAFAGEDAPGVLQWEDDRDGVRQAWRTTSGAGIKVAVLDSGIQPSHRELRNNVLFVDNTIPCNRLTAIFGGGIGRLHDCSKHDTEGHGTWVASRIAGDDNGFGSNGIAPDAKIMGYKVLATGFGGLTSWIVDGMVRACDNDADVINMSLGGYDDPNDPDFAQENAEDYFLWQDAVNYCRARGTAIVASAGNDHVRNLRKTVTLTGLSGTRTIAGAGVVSSVPAEGINALPGQPGIERGVNDHRGMLETPAGVPGVIMVSATGNTIANSAGNVVPAHAPGPGVAGTPDNLAYYSSYGERVDVTAPGGARKYGVPKFDTRPGTDVLFGGWGALGATDKSTEICRELGSAEDFACFEQNGSAFAWLQGTSMSAPQVSGIAALVLASKPSLRENPTGLAARLKATARSGMVNHTGKQSPAKGPAWDGTPCSTGFCHVTFTTSPTAPNAIPFRLAYGAGMVNAAAAVR